jgi:dTMP kinase
VIIPALQRKEIVLCDRFTDASYAYQGGGRGVSLELLRDMERWIHGGLQPDLTLYFDLPVEVARDRVAGIKTPDRFERQDATFFQRVRSAYLERAREAPWRIVIIDAGQPVSDIQRKLETVFQNQCPA